MSFMLIMWRAIRAACWLYESQFIHCVSGCTPYGCLTNYTAAKVGDLFKWSAGGTLHWRHEVAVNQLIIKQQQLVQMLYFIFFFFLTTSQQVLTETLQYHHVKYVFISLYCLLCICGQHRWIVPICDPNRNGAKPIPTRLEPALCQSGSGAHPLSTEHQGITA